MLRPAFPPRAPGNGSRSPTEPEAWYEVVIWRREVEIGGEGPPKWGAALRGTAGHPRASHFPYNVEASRSALPDSKAPLPFTSFHSDI